MNKKRIEETGTTHKICASNSQEAMTIAQSMLLSFLLVFASFSASRYARRSLYIKNV